MLNGAMLSTTVVDRAQLERPETERYRLRVSPARGRGTRAACLVAVGPNQAGLVEAIVKPPPHVVPLMPAPAMDAQATIMFPRAPLEIGAYPRMLVLLVVARGRIEAVLSATVKAVHEQQPGCGHL